MRGSTSLDLADELGRRDEVDRIKDPNTQLDAHEAVEGALVLVEEEVQVIECRLLCLGLVLKDELRLR